MNFDILRKNFLDELPQVKTLEELENLRIKYIGRKSELVQFLRSLKDLTVEEKREKGPPAHHLQNEIEEILNNKIKELIMRQEAGSVLDVTMPGKKVSRGHIHPLTLLEEEIRKIFLGLNFSVVEGPEVETEYYNFDALNIPADHPARDMQDTFWLDRGSGIGDQESGIVNPKPETRNPKPDTRLLMRTQTSSVQIRYMQNHQPPFQIISPGRVFRSEATDATHEMNFYQIEGLMVGKEVSLANFRFVITEFFKKLFNREIPVSFRPSYFPFVEPGLEVFIKYNDKWLEVMGAGMVHPKVFESVGYVPGEWQGFAFGMSLERLAMIKWNVDDIRMFYNGDLRFIRQF